MRQISSFTPKNYYSYIFFLSSSKKHTNQFISMSKLIFYSETFLNHVIHSLMTWMRGKQRGREAARERKGKQLRRKLISQQLPSKTEVPSMKWKYFFDFWPFFWVSLMTFTLGEIFTPKFHFHDKLNNSHLRCLISLVN